MNIESMHSSLIILHSVAGAVGFVTGVLLILSARHDSSRWLFGLYWWFLVGLSAFLGFAMLVYWSRYSSTEKMAFTGLFVLSLYMVYRAQQARSLLQAMPVGWQPDYIEHIGFTLISLFEGLIIVSMINLGSPWWIVASAAVLGILLGRRLIGLGKQRAEI